MKCMLEAVNLNAVNSAQGATGPVVAQRSNGVGLRDALLLFAWP